MYHTWYTKTHELAKCYGLDITDLSKQVIKATIEKHYIESWKEKLRKYGHNFPILRTYWLFKMAFECESYLSLVKVTVASIEHCTV